jgi:signal transduction histidine kinase
LRLAEKGWFAWGAVSLLALLCGALAVLQYRWTGEISAAELEQLHKQLGNRMDLVSQSLNETIQSSIGQTTALFSQTRIIDRDGPWSPPPHDSLNSDPLSSYRIEVPRPGGKLLIAELDPDYVRQTLIPGLLKTFLNEYDAAVFDNRSGLIYESGAGVASRLRASHDASVNLLRDDPRGRGPGPPRGFGPPGPDGRFGNRSGGGRPGSGPPGRWLLVVRHHAGSLDAMVAQVRRWNIAVSLGMLLLIVATVALRVQLARRQEQLAGLQMNFVTGVSHELRTPLTVIRTAAFNLQGKLARNPDQVERYGNLIQNQSEKLTQLVEQVLLFARADSAPALQERRTVEVGSLIEAGLRASGIETIDKQIESGLPPVSVDEAAMAQALRNLLDNAVRYGDGHRWIGIRATARGEKSVEIRVADHGPGIPDDEQSRIFEAFFRGRRAISDQIHGTGLGLNLTRRIIEANGGAIRVESQPRQVTEFIVTLPAAFAG